MDRDVKRQIEYIDALRSALEPSSVNTESERVQSSIDPDKFGKIFARIDEEEKKLSVMKIEFIRYKVDAITAIKRVQSDKLSVLLHEHYINYKSFKVISELMNYSYDYVLELHSKAIKEFESDLIDTSTIPC